MLGCIRIFLFLISVSFFSLQVIAVGLNETYSLGELKAVSSAPFLKVGDIAPDFSLPSVSGEEIFLRNYIGKKNVMISFVPAAWTPVCSNQIYDYTFYEEIFNESDAIILLISVDNVPTLYAWTNTLTNLWYPVLSDFSPQGTVALKYGVLRPEGFSERAIFLVDKEGIIRYAHINDINSKPDLNPLFEILENLP